MTFRRAAHLVIACMLGVSLWIAVTSYEHDTGQQPGIAAEAPRAILGYLTVPTFAYAPMALCEERLAHWSQGRAYEKLMMAEQILPQIASLEPVEGARAHEGGGNDLSRVAGRAKWCLERLLGVSLPDVRPDSSPKELRKLRDQATALVDVYRNGVMAAAAERRLSPASLEELRRKYGGKVVPDGANDASTCPAAMEALLGEWPPVGGKYEDLVSIIGVKARKSLGSPTEEVLYRLDTGLHFGVDYFFVVRDGIIWSVRRETFS